MSKKYLSSRVNPWHCVEENKEYSAPIFNLLKRRMRVEEDEESSEGEFYLLEAPEWINVIPITSQGQIVLVEQYRHGIEKKTLEIPGGMVDAGETPRSAAERELREETGYRADSWKSLGKVSANPSMMTNYTHMFLAKECTPEGPQQTDEHERIAVHTVSKDDFFAMAGDGRIHHAIVLAAIARYLLLTNSER